MADTISAYKKKLAEKQEEIEILRKIIEMVSYNWNLKDVLQSVIQIVHTYTKSDSCLVYLVGRNQLILEASQNPHRPLGEISLQKGEGITGWVAKHKKAVMLPVKAYQDERFKLFNNLPEDKFESFLSLPIVFQSKVIGVINIQNRRRRYYAQNQILFLQAIACQIGGAIENARLVFETDILKEALEARKIIEKAKGILMRRNNLTETEAHKLLNKKSMNVRKSLKEISEAIILSDDVSS